MVNPKCGPAQIARNLIARREEAYTMMDAASKNYQHLQSAIAENELHNSVEKWRRACQDVRDFKTAHPSAFDILDAVENVEAV
jgi:hypothetical protein